MVRILLPAMPDGVEVWFEANLETDGYQARRLGLKVNTIEGDFVFASTLTIPEVLVAGPREPADADKLLLTWDDAVKGESQALAAAELNKLYDNLRALALKHDGSTDDQVTADFLGVHGIGNAATACKVEINPHNLLPNVGTDEPILRASARAEFKGGFRSPFTAGGIDAAVRIDVELTRKGLLQVLPRIDVPDLPHFSLVFPKCDLQNWSLSGPSFDNLDLEFFRLPLQDDLGVKVTWTPNPKLYFMVADGKLKLATSASDVSVQLDGTEILRAEGVSLSVEGDAVTVAAQNVITGAARKTIPSIDLSTRLAGPFLVTLSDVTVTVEASGTGPVKLVVTLDIGRVLIRARTDPALVLSAAVTLELTYDNGKLTPKLTKFELVEPYPIELALVAAHVIEDGTRRLLSFLQRIEVPKPGVPGTPKLPSLQGFLDVLRRIGQLAAAGAAWLATQGVAGARALAGLAEAAFKLIADTIAALAEAIAAGAGDVAKAVVVEVRVDLDRWRIVQIVVTPADPKIGTSSFERSFLGFELKVPYDFAPALVCDLENGWTALVLQVAQSNKSVTLSTDLWLDHEKTGVVEPVSGTDPGGTPIQDKRKPLLQLTVTPLKPFAIALVMVESGKAAFFRKLTTRPTTSSIPNLAGKTVVPAGQLLLAARIETVGRFDNGDFNIAPGIDQDRILSMFRAPTNADPASPSVEQFSQYIRVKKADSWKLSPPHIEITLDVEISIAETKVDTQLMVKVDLESLSARIDGGKFDIEIDAAQEKKGFTLLGLNGKFVRLGSNTGKLKPLFLDFSDGDPRLGLNREQARIELFFDRLSSAGRGLGFTVNEFVVSRGGIDLDAAVRDEPVTLAGIDMPFRFDKGQMSVKRSRIQSFALVGHGNLPPALVGEAKASIELNFAQLDGALALQAAKAVLDKTADPLRCEGTQFTISLTKLGLKFVEQGGYHFYFTLTGSAEFRPDGDSFAGGLLKNLSSLRIVLDEAPLAADPSVLLNHIEFQVPVDPPNRTNFFDLFGFELRGVGFHPAAKEFGGSPAFSISGQVNFTDFGDVVTPRFDFHKLWIAPPEAGKALPRVRFDGLGVGLSLGAMGEAFGTAIAVDGSLPTLFKPDSLPANVTAKGFLASGSLRIQGWASMSASMGFLELEKQGVSGKRPAFFLYIQRNDMSEKIPTPIGTIFLREVGFGFGYRYTLAGLAAADKAETPRELVKLLDEVSKYQGSLDDVKAWLPQYDSSDLTLALRGLFSLTSASSSTEYNHKGEKDLPNLVLFDIVAALRTDLTFLMNLRAWVAYNYADWRDGRRTNAPWRSNPTLTGYLYLSVPRREFLARAVYNPGAEIGDHPKLPDELKTAMKAVRWSSTLYIRPGLFHMEYGWPYELGFSLGKPDDTFFLAVEGGTVLRFEDAAILYGLAFRARGHIRFAYDTGGDFGASVSAEAKIALGAKLIAYLAANVSDSMFYGVIKLDITVEFSVRAWMKSEWFSLSAGFSQSITIHVGVELLVEPNGIAGRVEASVAVGAFGRTLSLGIGFTLGDSRRLDSARARVERFLSLGLGSTYPDPEAGVPVSRPAPLPEPSRAGNAQRSDNRVEQGAERRNETARLDTGATTKPFDIVGIAFGETVSYWALLFPIAAEGVQEEHYLIQLVPCDNSFDGGDNHTKSHFYAAPITKESEAAPYVVWGLQEREVLFRKDFAPVPTGAGGLEIKTDWNAPFGLHGEGKNATTRPSLGAAFRAGCFMAPGQPVGVKVFEATDIESIAWAPPEDLPTDPEAASIRLAAAARSRADAGPTFKRMQQVEEARSCFIATVAECAAQLALMVTFDGADAKVDKEQAERLEFDPRAIGLTFVLSRTRLKELFEHMDEDHAEPPKSGNFKIATRIPFKGAPALGTPSEILLFNPPKRMFRIASPMLKDIEQKQSVSGIQLSWDLEPAWTASKSIYGDPEFHLKHYRIERRIEKLGKRAKGVEPAPRQFTVKAADHIEVCLIEGVLKKRRLRSRLQFVDDLQDVDKDVRAALLKPALSSEVSEAKPDILTQDSRVVYAVLAVDCAGTSGMSDQLSLRISPPIPEQKGILKAIARFRYDRVPTLAERFTPPGDFLAFTVEEEEKKVEPKEKGKKYASVADEDRRPELDDLTSYTLRIRKERTVAVGVFGSDALTQARAEPAVPERDDKDPRENEVDVVLNAPDSAGYNDKDRKIWITRVPRRLKMRTTPGNPPEPVEKLFDYTITDTDYKKLLKALDIGLSAGSSARVNAARLYLRPELKEGAGLAPQWCPVQLQLRIGKGGEETAVDTTIERFEHPLDVQFQPIKAKSIMPSSGRLHLYHPMPGATFGDFIAATKGKPSESIRLLCDGDQRTGVKLAWNARPSGIGASREADEKLHSLIAGYDLFSLDTTAIPGNPDNWRTPLRFVAPLGRVQRLPTQERGLEPSETGDFARVEAFYPSGTQRLTDKNLDRSFGKRRAVWYSPAESFLLWPSRPLRRSVLTLPDETDIARLFTKQRPMKVRVAWVAPEKDGKPWPVEDRLQPCFAVAADGAYPETTLTDGVMTPELAGGVAGSAFRVDQLRSLLRRLVVCAPNPKKLGELDENDKIANRDPEIFGNLAISLTPLDKSGRAIVPSPDVPAEVTIKVSLAPGIHPILADTLDLLQYHAGPPSYRRYEPVLEAAPPLNADRLSAFFDETAADRDPAGWGVLRTLGLAAAFRLYDVEEGRFLESDSALKLLNEALARVLPRYANAPSAIGAPFVDVFFTTDGLAELVSHHGAAPHDPDAEVTLRDGKALALVQIELRPTVEPLSPVAKPQRFVHYATLKRKIGEAFTLRAAKPTGDGKAPAPILIEVDVLTATDGGAQRRVLLMQGATEGRFPLSNGETVSDAISFQPGPAGSDIAYVRFVALTQAIGDNDLKRLLKTTAANGAENAAIEVVSSWPSKDDEIGVPDRVVNRPREGEAGPWGRFADIPDTWLAAMLFNDGIADKPGDGPKILDEAFGAASPGNTLFTIAHVLAPRAAKQGKADFAATPSDPQKRLDLVSRLAAWTRRFMEHGPARKGSGAEAGLAFGMLTRPNPWRLAPDKDGLLSIMLPEKDRWGKTLKYAVRPFGRYENLVRAQQAYEARKKSEEDLDPGKGLAPPAFTDSFRSTDIDDATKVAGVLYDYFADAVIERTEPLAAPVILATRRNDLVDDTGLRRPGNTIQVIVSRHPEEILSDANIRVDAGLAMRHVAIGFWREFAAPKWARKVVDESKLAGPIDLLAEFGPFRAGGHDYRRLPEPRALSIVKETDGKAVAVVPVTAVAPIDDIDYTTIRELYERHPDLWRGAYALNLAALPYGFRLHATAHAAAGVVVSPSSVATVDEAGYQLVLPWRQDISVSQAWQDKAVASPSWAIDRPAPEDADEPVKLVVRYPLVRLVDGMFKDARDIWFDGEDAPDLYRLPDPAVSYRLSIETRDGRVRVGEVDIGAVTNDPDEPSTPRHALYLNQLIGTRFAKPDDQPIPSVLSARLPTHFELALTLTVKGDAPSPRTKPSDFELRPMTSSPRPGDLRIAAADMAMWGVIAPEPNAANRTLALTLTPPDAPDPNTGQPDSTWTAFRTEVVRFVAAVETYAALARPQRVKDIATSVTNQVRPYAVDRVANWPGPKNGGQAEPATLQLPWVLGLPAEGFKGIGVGRPGGWIWPAEPLVDATNAAARAVVVKLLDDALAAAAGNADREARLAALRLAVLDAMRARAVAWRRFHDEQPLHMLRPLRRSDVPDKVTVAALPPIAVTDPFDLVATIRLPRKWTRTEADVEAAIAALEDEPNTADTLDALVALARQPEEAAEVAMRWSCRAVAQPSLESLSDGAALDLKITTIILNKPALLWETRKLAPANLLLPALVDELTEEMLFGPQRRLVIQAFHGLAKPAHDAVERDQST
ncbi:hypothetical protein [Mesorhizobium sp. ANAO-SY3R2]|uniref:hypothetical protein n=1 Tax=Mesorhizobium sp. ANAO-SY3R2 TaxID=3166644 RepID=UPI00366C379A